MKFSALNARRRSEETGLKWEREQKSRQREIEQKLAPLLKKTLDCCLGGINGQSAETTHNNIHFFLDSSWHTGWKEENHPFHRLNPEEQPVAVAWLIRRLKRLKFRVEEKHDSSDSDFGSSFSWYLDIWW